MFREWFDSIEGPGCCACLSDAQLTWDAALEEAAKILDSAANTSITGFDGVLAKKNYTYLAGKIRELKSDG